MNTVAAALPQTPEITILVDPSPETDLPAISLVTDGLTDACPFQKYELMLSSSLEHESIDAERLEGICESILRTGEPIHHESGAVRDDTDAPFIGVLARDYTGTIVVKLIPFRNSLDDVMTCYNPRWDEFLARLEGPEGIDQSLSAFVGAPTRFRASKKKQLARAVTTIFARMGMNPSSSWKYFARHAEL